MYCSFQIFVGAIVIIHVSDAMLVQLQLLQQLHIGCTIPLASPSFRQQRGQSIANFYQRSQRICSLYQHGFSKTNPDDDGISPEIEDENDDESLSDDDNPKHPIYWIDETEPHRNTRTLAAKNAKNLFQFLSNKFPAPYNVKAFEHAKLEYERYCSEVSVCSC